jgi:uncharacterized delta-60 repeat protein
MAGTLDKTFGTNKQGWTASTFNDKDSGGNSLVTDSSGNIFVTGTVFDGVDFKLIIAKYKSNGVLDTSWGINGYVSTIFSIASELIANKSLVIDGDGNIFVTGYKLINNINQLIVAKYSKNGELDTNFGNGGWIVGNFDSINSIGLSLVLDDSNIFVTGIIGDVDTPKLLVAKYTKTGVLDTNFGKGGWIVGDFYDDKSSFGISLVLDGDGDIFVTGYADGSNTGKLLVAKYTKTGLLADDFGDGGWIVDNFYGDKESSGLSLVLDDGNIFVTGYTYDDNDIQRLLVAKYTKTGLLADDFGNGGWIVGDFYGDKQSYGTSLVLDDGNIFVTGYAFDDGERLLVAKYTSTGKLDKTFGNGGWIVGDFYGGKESVGFSLVLDANGDIIVVGLTGNGTIDQLLLAKYLNPNIEPICVPAGTPILTDQGTIPIDLIDPKKHTIANHRIVAITRAITPEKYLVCFEANSIGINCPSKRTLMTPGHEVLYKGKLVQAKHFIGRVDGVHSVPYNGKDVLYNVLQERHGLMKVNNMVLETLHPENKVAKALLQ